MWFCFRGGKRAAGWQERTSDGRIAVRGGNNERRDASVKLTKKLEETSVGGSIQAKGMKDVY